MEKEKEENFWQRKIFGQRRGRRTESRKRRKIFGEGKRRKYSKMEKVMTDKQTGFPLVDLTPSV